MHGSARLRKSRILGNRWLNLHSQIENKIAQIDNVPHSPTYVVAIAENVGVVAVILNWISRLSNSYLSLFVDKKFYYQ
jgi:hypothetical protein